MSRVPQLGVTLPPELRARVDERARAKRWPVAVLVRESVELYLAVDAVGAIAGARDVLERDVLTAALEAFRALPGERQVELLELACARRRAGGGS